MYGIREYRLELDADLHPVLVMENEMEYGTNILNAPDKVVNMCNELMRVQYLAEEYVWMISFSSKGHVLGIFQISHGTFCSSECNPREIMIRALVSGACTIIIVHNHPSGDCTPSGDDITCCRRLEQVGTIIGIKIRDFIIIGRNSYYSALEYGVMES